MSSRVGIFDHLGPLEIPINADTLADAIVNSNYGTHRMLSALIRARRKKNQQQGYDNAEDTLINAVEKLLQEGHI